MDGEGHLLVFNNGGSRKPQEYSSVEEFVPPTDAEGNYILSDAGTFGPDEPLWSYVAANPIEFYSWFISGAQRLPNGNTLINAGAVRAMEGDINPEWVTYDVFDHPDPANAAYVEGSKLLPDMQRPGTRFLEEESRDFVALYLR